ncbi:MAG TPA: hypothetical protein VLG36_04725, partial [Candidatus Chromulinivoraceae bacterium]|nr:hypothetical protein [Candidatus Chromulinivoraceae bacterium]
PASEIFTPKYAPTIEADARKYCINNVEPFASSGIMYFGTTGSLNALYQPAFLAAMRANNIYGVAPEFSRLLDQNLAGEALNTPVLLVSGKNDQVILVGAQEELAKRICADGSSNLRWELSGATHYAPMFNAGRAAVMDWMATIINGGQPQSQCDHYAVGI